MLPSLENLSNLELFKLASDPDEIAKIFLVNRTLKLRPPTEFQPEEFMWLKTLELTGGLIKQMLEELSLDEIIECYIQKTGKKRRKGNPHKMTFVYDLAQAYLDRTGKGKMEVYQEMVLPLLIEFGEIQTDSNGEPDPYQEEECQRSYLKALQRRTPRK